MASTSSIGAGTTVRGSVHGDGDLEILGRVEGSVAVSGELSIGETALIKSDVTGRRVIVRGAIAGNVSATEAIVLEPGARVAGDLGAPQIGIRPGALVRGHVSTAGPLAQGGAPSASRGRAAPAAAPARAAAPTRAAAPAAPARPAARPAPAPPARPAAPARPAPRVEAPKVEAKPVVAEPEIDLPAFDPEMTSLGEPDAAGGPPPPVVPAIRKGQKAQIRRKGAR